MDKDLQNKIDTFIEDFLNVPEVKQFLLIKKEIEVSEEFKKLKEGLKSSQKKMALSVGTKDYDENKKAYLLCKEEYDNNPLVVNYNALQEEVSYLLEELKSKFNYK